LTEKEIEKEVFLQLPPKKAQPFRVGMNLDI